jgi:AcrR family transcriptional regulator
MSAVLAADTRLQGRIGMPIRLTVGHRERVLDAMRDAVVERGYIGTSCREICERAGFANNMFYELFADKEECLLALFDRGVAELTQIVPAAYASGRSWPDRVHAALGALLAWLDGHPASANVVFVQSLAAGPRMLARRRWILDRMVAAVEEGRLDGMGRGRAKQPPALTAQAVVGGAVGAIASRLSSERQTPLEKLLPALMVSIVLPYRGRSAAMRAWGVSDRAL